MKEDENTASDWAKYAIAAPYNHREYSVEILKASAKIAKNNRAYGYFSRGGEIRARQVGTQMSPYLIIRYFKIRHDRQVHNHL